MEFVVVLFSFTQTTVWAKMINLFYYISGFNVSLCFRLYELITL